MAAQRTLDASLCELLRTRLEALDGVVRAVVEEDEPGVWIIVSPPIEHEPVEVAVNQVLESLGLDPDGVHVRMALHSTGSRRRVRFDGIERIPVDGGALRVRVTLEWQDRLYHGEAVGEVAPAIELRTAANAALDAIASLIGTGKELRLIGVKPIRAFDAEMVVVSVHRTGPEPRRYVGAVMADRDPLRAAALAVLHALNRMLGNFLMTTD